MIAVGYILKRPDHSRGDAPVRDIAYAETRQAADRIIAELYPGYSVFGVTTLGVVEAA